MELFKLYTSRKISVYYSYNYPISFILISGIKINGWNQGNYYDFSSKSKITYKDDKISGINYIYRFGCLEIIIICEDGYHMLFKLHSNGIVSEFSNYSHDYGGYNAYRTKKLNKYICCRFTTEGRLYHIRYYT